MTTSCSWKAACGRWYDALMIVACHRRLVVQSLLCWAAVCGPAGLESTGRAAAELPEPKLFSVTPPAGRQGTTVEVTLAGGDLDDVTAMLFSHAGISAVPVTTPPTEFAPEPQPVPGTMAITIAADVPPGIYDAAALGRFGVSNPRRFMVSRVEELRKTGSIGTPEQAMPVPLDAAVSGIVDANAADHYAIDCQPGERVRVELWARRLDSRLDPLIEVRDTSGRLVEAIVDQVDDDPVLDFTPATAGRHVVRVHDRFAGGGGEYFYRLGISTGPVVVAVFPAVAEVGESARITILGRGLGEGAEPMPGAEDMGLEQKSLEVDPSSIAFDAPEVPAGRLLSPRDSAADLVPLRGGIFDEMPSPPTVLKVELDVVPEVEPNDDPEQPQYVPKPAAIAGRFHPRGDRDWFVFEASAGEAVTLELFSRRLGSTTDASLKLERLEANEAGGLEVTEMAFADDGPQEFQGATVDRATLDPQITFTAPADGTYRVVVSDLAADSVTDPASSYVLQLRPPKPDFDLLAMVARPDRGDGNRIVIASTSLAAGGTAAVDLLLLRHDGFDGDVTVAAEDLPPGVSAEPVVIPGRSRRAVIVLQAADDAEPVEQEIRFVGRAAVGDAERIKEARSATLRWQLDNGSQPDLVKRTEAVRVAVTPDAAPVTVRPQESKPWETARGGRLTIPIDIVSRPGAKGPLSLTPVAFPPEMKLPDALKVPEVKIEEVARPEGAESPVSTSQVAVDIEPGVPPGVYTVALQGVAKYAFSRNPQAAERAKADLERVAGMAQQRAAAVETAKASLAVAEQRLAEAASAATEPAADLTAAVAAARQVVAEGETAAKAAEEERVRLEKVANDRAAASAAADIDVPVLLPPITVVVADAPVAMDAGSGVTVQAGGATELKVAVERKYGFAGPVTIEPAVGSPIEGLGLTPTTVAAEASEGVLAVTTTDATPPGQHTLTLKGKVSFFDREVAFEQQVPFVVAAKPQESPQP